MFGFIISEKQEIPLSDNCLYTTFSGINNRDGLFDALSSGLRFPDYFGRNWDALSECIRDLEWIEEDTVIVYHDNLSDMSEQDFDMYVSVLVDTMYSWLYLPARRGIKAVDFRLHFHPSLKKRLEEAISHYLVSSRMYAFGLAQKNELPIIDDTLYIRVPKVDGNVELLDVIYKQLGLPETIERSWDVLKAHIGYSEHRLYQAIFLYNDDLSNISDLDFKTYSTLLLDVAYDWLHPSLYNDKTMDFRAFFSPTNKFRLQKTIIQHLIIADQ